MIYGLFASSVYPCITVQAGIKGAHEMQLDTFLFPGHTNDAAMMTNMFVYLLSPRFGGDRVRGISPLKKIEKHLFFLFRSLGALRRHPRWGDSRDQSIRHNNADSILLVRLSRCWSVLSAPPACHPDKRKTKRLLFNVPT